MIEDPRTEKYVLAMIAAGKIKDTKELFAAYFEITEYFLTFRQRTSVDEKLTPAKKVP